jgi:hypothetical protein
MWSLGVVLFTNDENQKSNENIVEKRISTVFELL